MRSDLKEQVSKALNEVTRKYVDTHITPIHTEARRVESQVRKGYYTKTATRDFLGNFGQQVGQYTQAYYQELEQAIDNFIESEKVEVAKFKRPTKTDWNLRLSLQNARGDKDLLLTMLCDAALQDMRFTEQYIKEIKATAQEELHSIDPQNSEGMERQLKFIEGLGRVEKQIHTLSGQYNVDSLEGIKSQIQAITQRNDTSLIGLVSGLREDLDNNLALSIIDPLEVDFSGIE